MWRHLKTWLKTWTQKPTAKERFELLMKHETEDRLIEEARKRYDSLMKSTEQRDPRTQQT